LQIRDRIKELRRVKASELAPNPRNWRTHPDAQRDALRGVLAEIGYADALLARELSDGRLELVDGHLRAEMTPDALVPVLVLDVDEHEAMKILLTHDPLADMAVADAHRVKELIESCSFEHPQVAQMLEQLRQDVERANAAFSDPADRPEVDIPASFQVVVECASEDEQQAVYERMREEGFRCRVLTL
jgi:ParB-like chromosome segregation protein Spo0J